VIDAVLGDLAGRRSIRMRPVLLVGPPGCGKSRLARHLFERLGLPAITFPCGGVSDSAFAGTARRWSSTEPSLPLRLIRDYACANPGILLDEIEKPAAGKGGSGGRLWDALVGMLEPETARAWLDPYVDTEVDLTAVNWMATANDLRPIPDVLLDRFRILRMPEPSSAHLPALAAAMLSELCRERGQHEAWAGPLDGIELQALRSVWRGGSLRALRRLCEGVRAAREQALPRV
jgi:ATP-dependent Lon protease